MTSAARALLIVTAAGVLAAGPAGPARAESLGFLGVYQDETAGSCEFTPSGPALAYVVLTHSLPAQQLTFIAPRPDCVGLILNESSPFSFTGDSQTGITIDLGGCTAAPVTVLTILHSGVGDVSCCIWPVGPDLGLDAYEYEFVDCNGITRAGQSAVIPSVFSCCYTGNALSAYDPYPPDGATNVPTNVVLSWTLPEETGEEWLFLDELPYPPGPVWGGTTDYFTTYEPANLQPNTTYYWMIGLQLDYDHSSRSDLWSFTTGEGPVSAEESTWGRIKALYE